MFTAVRLDDVLRQAAAPRYLRVMNVVWFAAITFSTLAVKQHVALDALAGALLGLAFAIPSMRWRPAANRSIAADIIPTHRRHGESRTGATADIAP
jgi:hypothetical protein